MLTQNPANSSLILPICMACLGALLIGLSGLFVRASDLGPMTTGFYRLLFSLPFLYMWMVLEQKNKKPSHLSLTFQDYKIISLAGLFFAVDLALWNWSIDYTTIVNATLFNNTSAFFVPLLMWTVFQEKITLRTIIAAMCGFLGCMLLSKESFKLGIEHLVGDIIALLSGLMVTSYVITLNRIRKYFSTGFLMFWTGIVSLICMGFFSLVFKESFWPLTPNDWVSIFGQAFVVHFMGQGFLAYSFGKISASYGALIMLLAPVTAAIFGWIIFKESLRLSQFAGISIIMISIVAVRNN